MRAPIRLKETARHPKPHSGAAMTAAAAAAAGRARSRSSAAALVSLGTVAALVGTAAKNPAASAARPTAAAGASVAASPARVSAQLDVTPPRKTVGLEVIRNGWVYDCMECHTLLGARWRYDRPLNEHQDIALAHGNNRYCLNCHHPTNRNAFADYDGAEIAPGDVVSLCAKCHGTIFRDWQAGVHGRQNGHWIAAAGAKAKLRCIQCHDPHQPTFPAMKPLAPLRYPPRAANPPARGSAGFAGPP